jgi:hypothetical protein
MMTEEEIYADVALLVKELTADGVNYFKGAIDKSKLRLTDELYDSVNAIVIKEAAGLGMEAQFFFKDWWRYKDMKQLNYATVPNIDAMKDWIDKIGVSGLGWVNGYETRAVPTVKNAKTRFLNTLLAHYKKVPVVKHDNKRRLYNKTKSQYMNVLRMRLSARLARKVPVFMKDVLERE